MVTINSEIDLGTEDVLFERRGLVAWVMFNRPEARNAMTFAMYDALVHICEHVAGTPDRGIPGRIPPRSIQSGPYHLVVLQPAH